MLKPNYGIKFIERAGVKQGFVTWHSCYYTQTYEILFHVNSDIILIHTQKNLS